MVTTVKVPMFEAEELLRGVILFDMTDLLETPIRTGIQRVTHQLSLHWPADRPLIPFRVKDQDTLEILDPDILLQVDRWFSLRDDPIQLVVQDLKLGKEGEGLRRMAAFAARPLFVVPIDKALQACRALLSLELSMRTSFYGPLSKLYADKVYLLHYDYILWLYPEFNNEVDWANHASISEFCSVIRRYKHHAFISTATLREYRERINRGDRNQYPVIVPGTDGLGVETRDTVGGKASFVVVGTIEPRKQHLAIIDAIERVQARGFDVELTVIGKMGWLVEEDRRRFERTVAENPRITWLKMPGDAEMIAVVKQARASIFFSRTEGFGGPPVESLSLGVPTIVTTATPSVMDLPDLGQVRLDANDVDGLCAAIERFTDEAFARSKQDEIKKLKLPTWRSFIHGISGWIDETTPLDRGVGPSVRERLAAFAMCASLGSPEAMTSTVPAIFQILRKRGPTQGELDAWLGFLTGSPSETAAALRSLVDRVGSHGPKGRWVADLIERKDSASPKSLKVHALPASYSVSRRLVDQVRRYYLMPSSQAFILDLYANLLRRTPGNVEVDGWLDRLASGYSRREALLEFLTCDEYRFWKPDPVETAQAIDFADALGHQEILGIGNDTGDADFLARLYQAVFRREPDGSGRRTYLARLQGGEPRASVALEALLSDEGLTANGSSPFIWETVFLLYLQSIGGDIGPGGGDDRDEIRRSVPSVEDMISVNLLVAERANLGLRVKRDGRDAKAQAPADTAMVEEGLSYAARLLGSQHLSEAFRREAGAACVDGEVAKLLGTRDTDAFLRACYATLLRRDIDQGGRESYTANLKAGWARPDIISELVGSEEFAKVWGPELVSVSRAVLDNMTAKGQPAHA